MPEQTEWLTVAEAAKWLRVSPVTVYRLLHEGTIPFRSVGRAYQIKVTDLEAHVAAHGSSAGLSGSRSKGPRGFLSVVGTDD